MNRYQVTIAAVALASQLRKPIGNGWQGFQHVFVTPREERFTSSRLTIHAVTQDGDLLWYRHDGHGENDASGTLGWRPNSGNPIGNGW